MARLLAVLTALVLVGGCSGDPAPAETVTETTTATPSSEETPDRDEAAYLTQLRAYDKWDADEKLAIGHELCDELDAGTAPQDLDITGYVSPADEVGLAENLGLAVRALCPDAL